MGAAASAAGRVHDAEEHIRDGPTAGLAEQQIQGGQLFVDLPLQLLHLLLHAFMLGLGLGDLQLRDIAHALLVLGQLQCFFA